MFELDELCSFIKLFWTDSVVPKVMGNTETEFMRSTEWMSAKGGLMIKPSKREDGRDMLRLSTHFGMNPLTKLQERGDEVALLKGQIEDLTYAANSPGQAQLECRAAEKALTGMGRCVVPLGRRTPASTLPALASCTCPLAAAGTYCTASR